MLNVSVYPVERELREKCHREWRQLIDIIPSNNIYHLPEWSETLEKSFGYEPFHLLARDEKGALIGVLPLMRVKSILTGNRLVSLPFSYLCGPLASSEEALAALLGEARKLVTKLKCQFVEIKVFRDASPLGLSIWNQQGFRTSDQFSTFVLELSQPETVWKKLDPKSVRWAVGKAQRDGVTVRKCNSPQDIETFYKLNLKTKKRIGVPGHPQSLFINMFAKLGDRCNLYLADYQNEVIAGIITQKLNNSVLYGYGASDDNFRIHQPNSLLVWTAIEESCREGFRYFDFGRTSPVEQNLTSFKKHWGTGERALSYHYYPQIPDSMALNDTGTKYKIATGLWKRMPLSAARVCSDAVFRHVG